MIAVPGQPEDTGTGRLIDKRAGEMGKTMKQIHTSIHQTPTLPAEIIRHSIPRGDRLRHSERLDFILASHIFERRIANGEVGREHRCCELAAVDAIADKLFLKG